MRVVSETDTELVLEHRPLVLPAVVAALVVAVAVQTLRTAGSLGPGQWAAAGLGLTVGAFIAYLTALRSRVVFDGLRREVRWQHRGWPGGECDCRSLDEIRGVEVHSDSTGSSAAERVSLRVGSGLLPLTRHFSGAEPHEENAAAIRAWLERQQRAS